MKKKTKSETMQNTLECIHAIKQGIDLDPKIKVHQIIENFEANRQLLDNLKQLGVINETKAGRFWIGDQPNIQLVLAVRNLQKQYRMDYHKRKSESEFKRLHTSGFVRGKHEAENIPLSLALETEQITQTDKMKWEIKTENKTTNTIKETKPIRKKARVIELRIFGIKLFSLNLQK